MTLTEHETPRKHCFIDENYRIHGVCKEFYDNGNLKRHCIYRDGSYHGECKEYYENGQLRANCFYQNDTMHGEYKDCYINGIQRSHCIYIDGNEANIDASTLSNEDKIVLTLQYEGLKFLV